MLSQGLATSIWFAIDYFKNKEKHNRCFISNDIDANYLYKVFNPQHADERKIWICQHQVRYLSHHCLFMNSSMPDHLTSYILFCFEYFCCIVKFQVMIYESNADNHQESLL